MNRYGENTVRAHHESRFMRQWCTQLRAQGEIRSNTMKTELSVIKKKRGKSNCLFQMEIFFVDRFSVFKLQVLKTEFIEGILLAIKTNRKPRGRTWVYV